MFTDESHAQKHIMTGHVVAVQTIRRGFFFPLFYSWALLCGLNQPLLSTNVFYPLPSFSPTPHHRRLRPELTYSSFLRPLVSIFFVLKVICLSFLLFKCDLSLPPPHPPVTDVIFLPGAPDRVGASL